MTSSLDQKLQVLESSFRSTQKLVDQAYGEREGIRRLLEQTTTDIEEAKGSIELWEKSLAVVQTLSDEARNDVIDYLRLTAENILRAIIGSHLSLKIDLTIKNNRWSATPVLIMPDGAQRDLLEGTGFGITDCLSLAQRLALLPQSPGNNFAPLIIDEPFRHLSAEYEGSAALLLSRIPRDTNRQLIVSTHISGFVQHADNVIHIGNELAITEHPE